MEDLSKDVVTLLQYLMPGFLVAWVFYGLTSHPIPSQFERVVQALIFTLVVRVFVSLERSLLEWIGSWWALGHWGSDADLFASLLTALGLGLVVVMAINGDSVHRLARRAGISTRSAYSSEWAGAFSENVTYVVLHLNDERRLYGWPKVWPSKPDEGHFYIMRPSWIVEEKDLHVQGAEGLLINVRDVKWVEFVPK
jgi:hypothetical protein